MGTLVSKANNYVFYDSTIEPVILLNEPEVIVGEDMQEVQEVQEVQVTHSTPETALVPFRPGRCEVCQNRLASNDAGVFCDTCGKLICIGCVYACSDCYRVQHVEKNPAGRDLHYTTLCPGCDNACSWHPNCQGTLPVIKPKNKKE